MGSDPASNRGLTPFPLTPLSLLTPFFLLAMSLASCAGLPEHPVDILVDVSAPAAPAAPEPTPPPAQFRSAFAVFLPAGLVPARPCEPTAPRDLIARARASFALPAIERAEIQQQIDRYMRHPGYLERVLTRGGKYLHFAVEELERRGMPGELAFLPVVESAFDPFAYSRGRASGLWQFIPGTGRVYGLRQDWWYDARRDVEASTLAALNYLQALGEMFEGDWLLAIAGYNAGEGSVVRAMRRNRQALRPVEFWDLRLPRETRAYVPRLLALKRIITDPAAFGLTLPVIPDRPYFTAVDTGGQIDLALAAELAGLAMDDLYSLNPGHNRWATPPDGPHRLLVPVEHHARFVAALAELPADRRVSWERHQIQRGDSLGSIARRYGTTVAVLRSANRLSGSLIRAGDHLMIPRGTGAGAVYRVRRGDTLSSIARAHGTSVNTLAAWNAMSLGDTLAIGRDLIIRAPGSPMSTAATPKRIQYTVRRGDSLYRISTRFKVTVRQLMKWNSLSSEQYLQPGQRLVLYVDVTRQTG
ncbi:LysM peptidoglycan-binding domain-containing protein [soil metagenome]